jgi:hypothetical protein
VRVVFYLLVAVNLVYLAWAGWIAAPAPTPTPATPSVQAESLASLALVSEARAQSADDVASSATPLVPTAAPTTEPAPRADASRCVSVGPFNDLAQAARGAALLRDRGFAPRQRAEQGGEWEGFWVFIGGLSSAADETKVMKALERAGIRDASPMPESGSAGRRVSVGLFSERDRAERRAQAVKRLGYNPEITERKQAGTVYWVDLDVGASDRAVPTEGLLSLETTGARLEIRVCPPVPEPSRPTPIPRDARPAATTADAGVPRPS